MASDTRRPLKVFLCHASGDKPAVRALYQRLAAEGVDAWLDQEKLLPGQDWQVEIPRAVHDADVVVICLSKNSVTKEGYVQKEIKFALDLADEKPEGTIFLIPARLEDCAVPERLARWQWVDLFEENGYSRLLRSLRLRADKVDAVIGPGTYAETDKTLELRLERIYTEGLAAFYTEDWGKACRHFQAILNEKPNHKNAAEKLAEAERQRSLAGLYVQSVEAYNAEDWRAAIQLLEELLQKGADYKDAGQLLKNARKQNQLKELYAGAKVLHAAQKWEAVLKVFEQISAIDPAYPDADGLLPSAQKEVAEIKRVAGLNDLYSRALREMDAGQWLEARKLLEQVHKAQTGFHETERLLKKVEDEIGKIEAQNERTNQVNVLYEQAHGLVRSKSWRKALDKMAEIQKLDDRFVDKDEIARKAKAELEREEQETQKQDRLAALYAEAVRLVKEEKFQEALEKWQAVRVIDPKYPDRQGVQNAAKKKMLQRTVQSVVPPERARFIFKFLSSLNVEWVLLLAFLAIVIVRAIYGVINPLLSINWSGDAPVFPPFLNLFVIGGFYGTVVALALGRVVQNWRIWHVIIVILGWALGLGLIMPLGRWGWNFFLGFNTILSSLSIAGAIKLANPKISWFRIILIFVCWVFVLQIGYISGDFIKVSFNNNDYIWCIVDAATILFGLLVTVGIYKHSSKRLVILTALSMLGFAAGCFAAGGLLHILLPTSLPISISQLIMYINFGFIGGTIIEIPSRNWKKILIKGGLCGLGLSLGYLVASLVPGISESIVLADIVVGAGLGLALSLPSRRISSTVLLIILGSLIFVVSSSVVGEMAPLSYQSGWTNILRGGLIGLVLGFSYAYVTRENKNQPSSPDAAGS
jgi:outer membrane protein assembly factor BamD (BamD/ComL family)